MKKLLAIVLALVMLMAMGVASAEEPVKLTWWLFTTGDAPVDWPEVEAKLNEISREKIGVEIEYKWMTADQINLATQSGEYFDLAFTCGWYNDYATNIANGMFLDIAPYMDLLAEAKALTPENIWAGVTQGEKIYGFPHVKDYGIEVFWILDTDFFVDELGLDPTSYEAQHIGFAEMGEYMAKYVELHPGEIPLKVNKGGATSWMNGLADWISLEYWLGLDWAQKGTEKELQVKSALDIPKFTDALYTLHDWYEKGYINADAAVTESMPRSIAGVVQSGQGWFGAETVWANAKQKACFISRFDGPYLTTDGLIGSVTAVSSYSEHPEEAVKAINLMNSDAEYRTIARYGIEGKHYEVVEPGIVKRTDLGNANMSLAAYTQGSYALGPVEASPFESVPANPNQWTELVERYTAEAITSSALGFMPNIEPVADQCLAMKNIWEQYIYEMQTGTSDPAEVVPQLKEELEAVGLNEVIAEIQAQLDAFMAAK
ncbi:MAG: ABC transporter substrate-binding protein [Clostridia bacterium]|nr:ABC transporter substrate-binding protein [Clostridia bacterium]